MTYRIARSFPIPTGRRRPRQHYPLREMQVGDSFRVPRRYCGSLWTCARHAGVQICSRAEGRTHVRVWRVA